MIRVPRRGELQTTGGCQVTGNIWRSRHEEPPLLEPMGLLCDYVVEPNDDAQLGADLWRLGERVWPEREAEVMVRRLVLDETLDEIALTYGVTRERVRQIEASALRRLRHWLKHPAAGFGGMPYPSRWSPVPPAKHPGYAWESSL